MLSTNDRTPAGGPLKGEPGVETEATLPAPLG
jgi:hypothetical protein